MTTSIAPPRTTTLSGRLSPPAWHRPSVQAPLCAPFCSLKARPAPHPAPAPTWEDLLGQR